MMEVVKSINKVSDKKASDAIVVQLVPKLWPMLSDKMAAIPDKPTNEKQTRTQHEILEELVTGVRNLNARMRDFDPESRDPHNMDRRYREFHPAMLGELLSFSVGEDSGASLVMLAGLIREQLPWMAELMIESYRELRTATPEEAKMIAFRLNRAARSAVRGPMGEKLMRSKGGHMLAMELPHLIDRVVMPLLEPLPNEAPFAAETPKE